MTVNVVLQKIHQAMASRGLRQIDLSIGAGIPQATLSRSLNAPVRVTRTHREICKFLRIEIDATPNLDARSQLVQAVTDTWDGTEAHAKALLSLLQAASKIAVAGAREQHLRTPAAWRQSNTHQSRTFP